MSLHGSQGCFNMGQLIDLVGKQFGRWTVIKQSQSVGNGKKPSIKWICKCDCGEIREVFGHSLRSGASLSCGCVQKEYVKNNPNAKTHGNSKDRLYGIWRGMIDRCYYPSHNRYHVYGGRGIRICGEWKSDFSIFRDWAMANGYDPGAPRGKCTIDRIDVNGNYEPSNCRWVDMKTQIHNKQKVGEF